jgi:hypothetical protein
MRGVAWGLLRSASPLPTSAFRERIRVAHLPETRLSVAPRLRLFTIGRAAWIVTEPISGSVLFMRLSSRLEELPVRTASLGEA